MDGKISDEIRGFVQRSLDDGYMDPKELLAIADRIDAETVELPKSADGEIWTSREVCLWTGAGHEEYRNFQDLVLRPNGWYAEDDCGNRYAAESVWYERPDSLKRIADDIETFGNEADINDAAAEFLSKIQERIYTLAKKEDHE